MLRTNIHDDLSSLDLGIREARDLAQNRPLWRPICRALGSRSGACRYWIELAREYPLNHQTICGEFRVSHFERRVSFSAIRVMVRSEIYVCAGSLFWMWQMSNGCKWPTFAYSVAYVHSIYFFFNQLFCWQTADKHLNLHSSMNV